MTIEETVKTLGVVTLFVALPEHHRCLLDGAIRDMKGEVSSEIIVLNGVEVIGITGTIDGIVEAFMIAFLGRTPEEDDEEIKTESDYYSPGFSRFMEMLSPGGG